MKEGIVYLVGAGPGDPKLITVYGLECIQKADVIAYDRLVNPKLLDFAKKDAELVYCGKLPGKHHLIQDEINALLVERAQEGKVVTRLKGGDPFVFGRGAEEAEILKNHDIRYEVVPGITAGIAAPAYAGIPVTHRDFATSFATGIDTVAFYMSVGNIAYIAKKLIDNGRPATTPVAVIEWGTTEQQRTITGPLNDIASIIDREGYHNPSMIVVGDVVKVREKIQWFEEQGLAFS